MRSSGWSTVANNNSSMSTVAAGKGCGLGLSLVPDPASRELIITRIQPNTHAARSNLAVGDVVLEVDGHAVTGASQSVVRSLVTGAEGTPVNLLIKRHPTDVFSVRVLRSATQSSSSVVNASPPQQVQSAESGFPNNGKLSNLSSCGIGMRIARNGSGSLYVVSMSPSGPAAQTGVVQPGDTILQIGEEDVQNASIDTARSLVLGPAGTYVTLRLRRSGRVFSTRILRAPASVAPEEARPSRALAPRNQERGSSLSRISGNNNARLDPAKRGQTRSVERDIRHRSLEPPQQRGPFLQQYGDNRSRPYADPNPQPRSKSQEPNRNRDASLSRIRNEQSLSPGNKAVTPAQLWRAATSGEWVMVRKWVAQDPSLQDSVHPSLGCTLAHVAAVQGRVNELTWLARLPSWNPFAVDKHGNNLAHVGAVQGHIHVLDWLSRRGECDLNATNRLGDNVSNVAARQKRSEVLAWLARRGASLSESDLRKSQTSTRLAASRTPPVQREKSVSYSDVPDNRWESRSPIPDRGISPSLQMEPRSISPTLMMLDNRSRSPPIQRVIGKSPSLYDDDRHGMEMNSDPYNKRNSVSGAVTPPRYFSPTRDMYRLTPPGGPMEAPHVVDGIPRLGEISLHNNRNVWSDTNGNENRRIYPPSPNKEDEMIMHTIPDLDNSIDYLGVELRAKDRLRELVCKGIISKQISEEMVDFEMRWERVRLFEWIKSVSGIAQHTPVVMET